MNPDDIQKQMQFQQQGTEAMRERLRQPNPALASYLSNQEREIIARGQQAEQQMKEEAVREYIANEKARKEMELAQAEKLSFAKQAGQEEIFQRLGIGAGNAPQQGGGIPQQQGIGGGRILTPQGV